ncbi:hypothetical protein, partial [Dickeya dianthicola]|uniref:hypothetical protein n=1 Tax=Dickeya dianthicola TaxID=204039 RepID=UPI001EE684BC
QSGGLCFFKQLKRGKFTYGLFVYFSGVIYLHHKYRYKTNPKRLFFALLSSAIFAVTLSREMLVR